MEDDDLFWRCRKEGLIENTYLDLELKTANIIILVRKFKINYIQQKTF